MELYRVTPLLTAEAVTKEEEQNRKPYAWTYEKKRLTKKQLKSAKELASIFEKNNGFIDDKGIIHSASLPEGFYIIPFICDTVRGKVMLDGSKKFLSEDYRKYLTFLAKHTVRKGIITLKVQRLLRKLKNKK